MRSKEKMKEEKEIPQIINSETKTVIEALKKEKSPDPNKITNEQIKNTGEEMIKRLVKIFNTIIRIIKIIET